MLMNKEEERAREICAWCNWAEECKDCPHREWPEGKWKDKPMWDYKKCEDWRYYLRNPIVTKLRAFLCWIGIHKWYVFVDYEDKANLLHRECIYCNVEQKHYCNKDYTFGYWGFMNRRLA